MEIPGNDGDLQMSYELLRQFIEENDCEDGPLLDRCCVVCAAKALVFRLEESRKVHPADVG